MNSLLSKSSLLPVRCHLQRPSVCSRSPAVMDQGNNFAIPGRAGNLVGSGLQQPPIRADPVAAVPPRGSLSINSAADALLAVAHGGREQATGGRGRPGRFNSEGSPVVASRTRRMSRLGCFGDTGCSRPIGIGNWELLPTGEMSEETSLPDLSERFFVDLMIIL